MANNIVGLDVESEPGFIIIQRASGPPVRYPLAGLITGGDMPELTPGQTVDMSPILTSLAQVVIILWKTLMEANILSEDYADNWDIQFIYKTLVDDLKGEWGE